MNNYIAILVYLRERAGDMKMHSIEELLISLGLEKGKDKIAIVRELTTQKLIIAEGGMRGGQIGIGSAGGGTQWFGSEPWYKPYQARITLDGLKYLQDELKMEREGSYNIHFTGNQNQLVVGSKHVYINAVPEIEKRINEIADKIQEANDIADKHAYLSILNQLKQVRWVGLAGHL